MLTLIMLYDIILSNKMEKIYESIKFIKMDKY
nr:MAG TPA: hypothetical protein [Caudoviricetes sp.]